MKQKWLHPVTLVQEFTPNEYVAVCGPATLTCNRRKEYTWVVDDHGQNCQAFYDFKTGVGTESKSGASTREVQIQNMDLNNLQDRYNVKWVTVSWLGVSYHHEGILQINRS